MIIGIGSSGKSSHVHIYIYMTQKVESNIIEVIPVAFRHPGFKAYQDCKIHQTYNHYGQISICWPNTWTVFGVLRFGSLAVFSFPAPSSSSRGGGGGGNGSCLSKLTVHSLIGKAHICSHACRSLPIVLTRYPT